VSLVVGAVVLIGCAQQPPPTIAPASASTETQPRHTAATIDTLLADPALARAFVAARVESLADGRTIYERNASARVIPASVMKILTAAVAAERLGWDFRFETRLEMAGAIRDGVLHGDLVVVGGGDPSISAQGMRAAPLFGEWRDALAAAGIQRVEGRLIGDDNAFDDQTLGAGWAWDYLTFGYAAPSSALSYNENVVVVRVSPGGAVGHPATIELIPHGHELEVTNVVTTSAADVPASIGFERLPGSSALRVRGTIPLGRATLVLTTTIENPTRYFAEALRLALSERGLVVAGGAWDIDDLAAPAPPSSERRMVATHRSQPLSVLGGYAMKASQNFYGEMLFKAIGAHFARAAATPEVGSAETGRTAVRQTLTAWGLPIDALSMIDGSGLSRYNYASAALLVGVLKHAWHDERLRGPFVASLPVSGHDGTLQNRMRNSALERRVQAKTGTITNVRSLAGYAETAAGEKLVFAFIANHFTAPTADVDRVMEAVLEELMN
jgi:D-alanyl-D-alanine carboxypeptidase/D-alanyl-D-alanine-endopeptidase (penicillin-binding protein 4)